MDDQVISKLTAAGIDVKTAVSRFNHNEKLYMQCLMSVEEEIPVKDLQDAMESGDYQQLQVRNHALKGVSGTLGILPLFEACSQLQLVIKDQKEDAIEEAYLIMITKYLSFLELIQNLT